jgi:hypothetical protein
MTKNEALELCDYLECNDASLEAQCKAAAFIREALAQPEQEPVEDVVAYHSDGTSTVRIAPKRPWVGLTAQEAADCWTTSATQTWHNFEAALRSKNI